jgi:lysophospholipase L1-like esterase
MLSPVYFLSVLLIPVVFAAPRNIARQDGYINGSYPTSDTFKAKVAALISAANLTPYVPPPSGSQVTEYLAIGDSYSAGVGADGSDDYEESSLTCNRFLHAMPHQLSTNPWLPGRGRNLNFGSCTGALVQDILDHQLMQGPAFRAPLLAQYTPIGKPQVATLSAGGNDLEFGK